MSLACLFKKGKPAEETLPEFIRALDDVEGVRILRLQGSVGHDIGPDVKRQSDAAQRDGAFRRPLLLDFADTTRSDFSTVAFLVDALRRRMAASARVGIVHAPPQLLAELEMSKVQGLFAVFESEAEALAALKGTGPSSPAP